MPGERPVVVGFLGTVPTNPDSPASMDYRITNRTTVGTVHLTNVEDECTILLTPPADHRGCSHLTPHPLGWRGKYDLSRTNPHFETVVSASPMCYAQTMTAHTRNITRAFRAASHRDLLDGMDWYSRANTFAHTLDPDNPSRAAGVIASLSPLTAWPLNVRYSTAVYENTPFRTLGTNMRSAFDIFNGANPEIRLRGPKVRAFYFTIADPLHPDAVTVDRHAVDIAYGHVTPNNGKERSLSKTEYRRIADMYIRAAKIISSEYARVILPHQVQAVTWVYWRRNMTRNNYGD